MDLKKMLKAIERMTPTRGANLVRVDTFEWESGEELSLVGHYATAREAERAKVKLLAEDPEDILHVYLPKDATTRSN